MYTERFFFLGMGMTHQCATVRSLFGGYAGTEMTRTSMSLRVTGSSYSQRKTEQCVLCSDLRERKTSKAAGLQPSVWHVALREPIRGVTTCRAARGLSGSSARAPDDVAATVVAAFVRSSARRFLLIALPRPRGTVPDLGGFAVSLLFWERVGVTAPVAP